MRPLVFRSILAATDLSPHCDTVLRSAAALAGLAGAPLHVVHAYGKEGAPATAEAEAAATSALNEQLARCFPHGAAGVASSRVLPAPPAEGILEAAGELDAGLLVIGAHRPREDGDGRLGGTADRMIRSAPVPCLVLRVPLRLPLRSVLAPTDLSGAGRGAMEVALAWTAALRPPPGHGESAVLRVLHVAEPGTEAAERDELAWRVSADVASTATYLGSGLPIVLLEEVVESASVTAAITAAAVAHRADLLVLGTRGVADDPGGRIGSVAAAVQRAVTAPIVLVPPAVWRNTVA